MLDSVLSGLADAVNPLLAVLGLAFPYIEPAACIRRFGSRWHAWIPLAIGLVLVYCIQFADSRFLIWPSMGMDYSTHTAFAVAIIASVAVVKNQWLPWLLVLLAAYGWLMLHFRYHTISDMVTSAIVIAPAPWIAAQCLRARAQSATA